MPYIGNTPAEKYAAFDVQYFTTSATTSYTLDHAVANELDIRLVINNVIQEPGSGKAYTASGTTLTLSGATAGTDTMYCVYTAKASQTVNPPAGSVGTSQLADSSVTNVKLGSDINATKLTAGLVPTARLGSGTASSSTFLRGDQTYAEAGGGSLVHLATIDNSNLSADVVQFQQVFSTDYKRYKVMGKFQGTANGANLEFSWLKSDNSNHNVSNYHTVGMGYKINSVDYNQEGWLDWGQQYSRLLLDQATGSHVHSFSMDLFPNGYDNVNYPQMYAQCNAWLHNSGGNKMFVGQVGSYLENTTSLAGGGVRFGTTSGLFGTVNFGIWGYKDS